MVNQAMNIYELHLGSWMHLDKEKEMTYENLVAEIVDYVVSMGFSHIELLPIGEHPFDGSWGYQQTGYYSVTSRFGTPEGFKYFVNACHKQGIGVILDWVPCHFCRDQNGLRAFDGAPLFESTYTNLADNDQWGTTNFDYSKSEVRSFLISNAHYWFDQFHIDGLRVDAVAFMLYLDYGKEHLSLVNEEGTNVNHHAVSFLRELNQSIFKKWPGALMIAEESTDWPLVTAPVHDGGLGFNYKWNMGWMNDMLTYMEKDPIHRKHHLNLLTFSLTYAFSENFILPLSHDEVVHGKKSLLNKMPGDYWQKFANLRLLLAYMVAHPGKKLIFMGGEIGQFIEWDYQRELDWFLLDYEKHEQIQSFTRRLNDLYGKETAFTALDHTYDGFEWIDFNHPDKTVISFMRKGHDSKEDVIVVANFTPTVYETYRIGVKEEGIYEEILNSDAGEFGGSGVTNAGPIQSESKPWHMRNHSVEIRIPPLGVVFLKRTIKRDKGEKQCEN